MNNNAFLFDVTPDYPYIKRLVLTFEDSNPSGCYYISEKDTYGLHLLSVNDPPNASSKNEFGTSLSSVITTSLDAGNVVVDLGDLWLGGEWLGEATTPVGVVFMAYDAYQVGSDIYKFFAGGSQQQQYANMTTFTYEESAPNTLSQASISAPAFDNYTRDNFTTVDAVLDTGFQLVVFNDFTTSHILNITATCEYGDYNTNDDYNTSTSVFVNIVPGNGHNSIATAQPVSYGLYGNGSSSGNPMLFVGAKGGSYDSDDYFNITVSPNYGTRVDVSPLGAYPFELAANLSVSDPYGYVVNQSSNTQADVDVEVTFVPSIAGNYTIHVCGYSGGGFYMLNITQWAVLSVSVGAGGGTTNETGVSWFPLNQMTNVQAIAAQGYFYRGWTADGHYYNGTRYNPFPMPMNQNHVLVANFTLPILTIATNCSSWGITNPAPGGYIWSNGSQVTASPYGGFYFDHWMLGNTRYSNTTNPITVNIAADSTLTAFFAESGGGSCPFVSTWNGTCYVLDNNILPQSEFSNGTDVTDYYTLQQPLVPMNGQYALMLSEFEHEHSLIDSAQLLAVDHPAGVNVGVSPSARS